jgi:hypothetical protein
MLRACYALFLADRAKWDFGALFFDLELFLRKSDSAWGRRGVVMTRGSPFRGGSRWQKTRLIERGCPKFQSPPMAKFITRSRQHVKGIVR